MVIDSTTATLFLPYEQKQRPDGRTTKKITCIKYFITPQKNENGNSKVWKLVSDHF